LVWNPNRASYELSQSACCLQQTIRRRLVTQITLQTSVQPRAGPEAITPRANPGLPSSGFLPQVKLMLTCRQASAPHQKVRLITCRQYWFQAFPFCLYGARFHTLRLSHEFVTSAEPATARTRRPTTPDTQRVATYTCRVWARSLAHCEIAIRQLEGPTSRTLPCQPAEVRGRSLFVLVYDVQERITVN
jgi:hypothetical protein